ncbi:MAG: MBL fold metallo-hydrolase [Myxococcales bacterium]|nr:MBL fold metallo-hydrolase [Myxococcales bacterium]
MHPDDFLWEPSKNLLPDRGIRLRWLGTAGFSLEHSGWTLLLDPYITRVGLGRFLFSALAPDVELIAAEIPVAHGIVVGHSHFDHVMDVPQIARLTGAPVWGSQSTANLLRACGIPEMQIHSCRGETEFSVGPFEVKLVPSEHSRFALGHRVPYAGDIPCSCDVPMRGSSYRCGDVFGIRVKVANVTIYHLGSANLIDDAISERNIDYFLMGISGRYATERYISRVMKRLTPHVVIPMHYDNFFRRLDAPLKLLPRTDFGRYVEDMCAFDQNVHIRTLNLGQTVQLA